MKATIPTDDRPTGTGKTTDAMTSPEVSVLLSPLRHLADQTLSRFPDARPLTPGLTPTPARKAVSTYHTASFLLSKGLWHLPSSPHSLVIDELPRLFHYSTFQPTMGPLLYALRSVPFMGLTASPSLLYDIMNPLPDYPWHFCSLQQQPKPTDPPLLLADRVTLAAHTSVDSILRPMSSSSSLLDKDDNCVLIFERSASEIVRHVRQLRQEGLDAGGIISRYNHSWEPEVANGLYEYLSSMRWEGRSLTDWILSSCDVPPTLRFLFLNDAALEGISILDPPGRIQDVYVQSIDRYVIEQARARVRHDIRHLTVVFDQREWLMYWRLLQYATDPSMTLRQRYDLEMRQVMAMRLWDRERVMLASKGMSWNILGPRPQPPVCGVLMASDGTLYENFNLRPIVRYHLDNLIPKPFSSHSPDAYRLRSIRSFAESLRPMARDGDTVELLNLD